MNPFFARRRLFVHPFQYRLLAANLAYGLLIALVVGGAVFFPLISELDQPGLSLEEKDRVAQQFLNLHNQLWPWLCVTLLVIVVHSVFFVHRVAGPMYRFRMIFQAIAEGRWVLRAKLRRHDYLHTDADELNDMLSSLESKARHIDVQLREIEDTCHRLPRLVDDRSRGRMSSTHAVLAARIRSLHESVELLLSDQPHVPKPSPAASEPPPPLQQTGFTLIEVMMVVTITGALAGIAIPNYMGYLDKARVVRAIAEISALSKEIDGYYVTSDETYPDSLAAIGRQTLLDPWGNPYQYLKIAGNAHGGGHAAADDLPLHLPTFSWFAPAPAYAGHANNAGQGQGNSTSTGGTSAGPSSSGADGGGTAAQGGNASGGPQPKPRKDRFLVPINSDYDLFSMGKDGESVAPLTAKASRDDVVRASDGAFIGLASNF